MMSQLMLNHNFAESLQTKMDLRRVKPTNTQQNRKNDPSLWDTLKRRRDNIQSHATQQEVRPTTTARRQDHTQKY
jgi:hypothetical protein